MAKIIGEKSRYLVRMDKANRIFAFLYLIILIGTFYLIFVKMPRGAIFSIGGLIAIIIIFGPLIAYAAWQMKKHEQEGESFFRGRAGEGVICEELSRLPDEFSVFRGIRIGRGRWDIDLVVLGPTGVYTVEVKSHPGKVDFNGAELTLNGRLFKEKNILNQAKSQALSLHDYLGQKNGRDFFVIPVLCFSSPYASMRFGHNTVNNVYVVQKRFLNGLLTSYPGRLNDSDIAVLAQELKKLVSDNDSPDIVAPSHN